MIESKKAGATEKAAVPLRGNALNGLSSEIEKPLCGRDKLTLGIVHIGVGNFHRAHLAWYVHRLMQQGQALDLATDGAGERPGAARIRPRAWLEQRDFDRTLVEESRFVDALEEWLGVILSEGTATALDRCARERSATPAGSGILRGGQMIAGTMIAGTEALRTRPPN